MAAGLVAKSGSPLVLLFAGSVLVRGAAVLVSICIGVTGLDCDKSGSEWVKADDVTGAEGRMASWLVAVEVTTARSGSNGQIPVD